MSEPSLLQLRAGATVADLLEVVDLVRLITVRDRLYPAFSASAIKVPAQQGYREYLRFLTIKILSTETPPLEYSPSVYIDQLWHAHILDTQAWLALTDRYPRDRLIHDPCPPEGLHASRLHNTIERYIVMFGEAPLRDATNAIWYEPGLPPVAVPKEVSTPSTPRSISPVSTNSSADTSLPMPAASWPATHVRILLYYNYMEGEPKATLESHTSDTIASIIQKYQTKRNLSNGRLSDFKFFLVTPGDDKLDVELSDPHKTLGVYVASTPGAVKRLAKSIEIKIRSHSFWDMRLC